MYELIKTVLASFVTYGGRTFILPKFILHKINAISNKFPWERPKLKHKIHQASISTTCLRKEKEGVNIEDVYSRNQSAICGLIFIFLNSEILLWSEWLKTNTVKNDYLWTMKNNMDSSWVWRNLLQLRVGTKIEDLSVT